MDALMKHFKDFVIQEITNTLAVYMILINLKTSYSPV